MTIRLSVGRIEPQRERLLTMRRRFAAALGFILFVFAPLFLQAQSISINPGYTDVGVNGTVQYSATVVGLANTSVTWSVSGTAAKSGTITSGGLYTAPATVPTSGVTITALASDKKTYSVVYVNIAAAGPSITAILPNPLPVGNYTATLTGAGFKSGAIVMAGGTAYSSTFVNATTLKVSGYQGSAGGVVFQVQNSGTLFGAPFTATFAAPQTISPATANVNLGATKQFTSAGATSWTANAGSISATGLYTAPATMPSSNKVTVTATGPNGSASATVTLTGSVKQTISPTTTSVNLDATQQFTSAGATSWTVTAGTISASGLYTAPATMPASSTVTITATGPNGSASATVTLINANPQTISPTNVSLVLGATQQFTSTGATSWTATAGIISATGLYTAPSTLPNSSNVMITATGPNGTASAVVTLIPPQPVISTVGNGALPLGIFSTTITGTGFTSQSVARLNGAALTTKFSNGALNVSGFYGQSGIVNITVSNGALVSDLFPVQVGVQNALASAAASRRFLEQAAFGPTPNDAAHVQTIGMPAWLAEQFSLPQISNYNTITSEQSGMPQHFLTNAVSNQDQLRQRVAFALSQIFVTSIDKLIWNTNMISFQNMLLADSFSNYRQIMSDVTLSAAMGQYLDMANNAKADPVTGSLANENYARELMQLFTTGTNVLNQDGTPVLDGNGLPQPVYTQATIAEFARVYTGWTYAPATGKPVVWGAYISTGNMVSYPAEHDSGSKQLLNGYVSPMGATPQQDLDNALDNIFNHPSVGPFVGTQLIQHLVKSNPSPAYVSRVAAAFNDNGHGVRGDMQAVIAAVLLDPEARANDEGGKDLASDGHLQEPALFLPAMVRAFGGQMNDQNYYSSDLATMGEDLFDSPSVFNYYSPTYGVPGTALMGGEFQIDTPNNAIIRANEVQGLMFSQWSNPVQTYGPGTTVDLTPFVALAATPSTLVDALDLTLTHGVMPAAMKAEIAAAVAEDSGSGSVHQVQTACYLILSSSYYNVWH